MTERPQSRDELLDMIDARIFSGESRADIARSLNVTTRTIRNWYHAADRPLTSIVERAQRKAQLDDPDWLIEQYVQQRRAPRTIAEQTLTTTAEVWSVLDRHGIHRTLTRSGNEPTRDELVAAIAADESQRSVARRFKVHHNVIADIAKIHGLRFPSHLDTRPPQFDDREWLESQVGAGRNDSIVAAQLGVTPWRVRQARRRFGITGVPRGARPANPILKGYQVSYLRKQYVARGLALAAIELDTGIDRRVIRRILVDAGVEIRHEAAARGATWLEKPEWLAERIAQGATSQMIADQLRIKVALVRSARRRPVTSANARR